MRQTLLNIWKRLENHPLLTMAVVVFTQTWFTLGNRALWFSDEVRYANAYQNLLHHGNWMVLALNGQPYPDKPPVYFWFLWLIDTLTPLDAPQIFFVGSALSGLFFLYSAYYLARTLGFNKSVRLASSLVLLTTFMLVALFHYSRMDLMFASLIMISHAFFYRAVTSKNPRWWPVLAFAAAGIATLVKGPLGFLFPLINTGLYLGWKGELKKLFTKKMGLGLLLMLLILAAWVGGVVLAEGKDFLINTVLGKQIIQRATKTFHHREAFYWYFIAFPLAWMPWTLFVFVTPVKRVFSATHWRTLWTARREAGPKVFLLIMFGATFSFLSSLSGKVLIYVLPMFPPLAILIADAMSRFDENHTSRLWTILSSLWIIAGMGLLVAGDLLPVPVPVRGVGISACVLILGGGAMAVFRSYGNRANLITMTLAITIWIYPVGLMVAPSLDDAMSPKRQALIMRGYVDQGYTPFSTRVYSGIYTYYLGEDYREERDFEVLLDLMAKEEKVVLVMREQRWKDIGNRLPDFKVVDKQSIAGLMHYITIKG